LELNAVNVYFRRVKVVALLLVHLDFAQVGVRVHKILRICRREEGLCECHRRITGRIGSFNTSSVYNAIMHFSRTITIIVGPVDGRVDQILFNVPTRILCGLVKGNHLALGKQRLIHPGNSYGYYHPREELGRETRRGSWVLGNNKGQCNANEK